MPPPSPHLIRFKCRGLQQPGCSYSPLPWLSHWRLRETAGRAPSSRSVSVSGCRKVSPLSALRSALTTAADGKRVVYRGSGPNGPQLYLRDSFRATPISGTLGAVNPFVSPDGRWVAFTAEGKLKKVTTTGDTALVICDYSGPTMEAPGIPTAASTSPPAYLARRFESQRLAVRRRPSQGWKARRELPGRGCCPAAKRCL